MFSFLTGKVQSIILTIGAALLPLLYLLGRRDQKAVQRADALEDALKIEKKKSSFKAAMSEAKNDIETSVPNDDRDALVERLRDKGL